MKNLSHVKGPEKEGQCNPAFYPTRADYIEGAESIVGSSSDDVKALQEQISALLNTIDSLQEEAVTGVKGSAESEYRTGNVDITAANIGLGNVNNTADNEKSVASAARLTTARRIKANLSVNDDIYFDGSSDAFIGIYGLLPIQHGGTGRDRDVRQTNSGSYTGNLDEYANPRVLLLLCQ